MLRRTREEDLPAELVPPLRETDTIIQAYVHGLAFIVQDAGRDSNYIANHLLSYLAQDFIQSAVSIQSLTMEGMHSVAKRELRFIVESSIKICFVQQKAAHGSTVADKLGQFDSELSSQRISIKNNLDLSLLPAPLQAEFNEEVGRLYGLTSGYVHLSPAQIRERIDAVDAGRAIGREIVADVVKLNEMASRCLAVSLALIFHSVPDWVAGDWLVDSDGRTTR
jgi:hypothetical protein